MKRHWIRWGLLLLLILIVAGLVRLRLDVEMLDLLPANVPAVEGLKIYQQHFMDSRELIITVQAPDRDVAEQAARDVAGVLQHATNLVANVIWQPPWREHPEQTGELIAYLWMNQPPENFNNLVSALATTNLASVLAATRDQLATTMSPGEIAQLSYDPYGFTRLPENVSGAMSNFGSGEELFSSADGTFRILFVKTRDPLNGYRECTAWFNAVKQVVNAGLQTNHSVKIGYTGRPAFTAEISSSMEQDMLISVGGTAFIIAILFWCAHRRLKPMLWLLALLALILLATLALGGLIFGSVNAISMGFAAILLGLAVDYAVVHYQEAIAQPELSIPQIRRAIAPSIFWAAATTISAFLVLNLGGLPGLAQLGSLVGLGVAISAGVMIFAFLPPLFPHRTKLDSTPVEKQDSDCIVPPLNPLRAKIIFAFIAGLILGCVGFLSCGLPKMDGTADALRPRNSQAYSTLDAIKANLNQKREPLWLIVSGADESEVARKLDAVLPILKKAQTDGTLTGFTLPDALWPRPAFQAANRAGELRLVAERNALREAASNDGFSEGALGLTQNILDTWQRAAATTNIFWPTNPLCAWIFEKLAAREPDRCFAVGFLYPQPGVAETALSQLDEQLPRDGIWLSGWELLGQSVLAAVKKNLWKLLLPMIGLILLSLWLAFRQVLEIFLSIGVLLLSGLCLLTVMKFSGWSWNLLNLMALPLILGTGVDYSIFTQLALRRHDGDLKLAHQSVGRALLLCGGTAIAGFGTLGLSSNGGLSSLGRICAIGIAGNMLISVWLLPVVWKFFRQDKNRDATDAKISKPSQFYGVFIWKAGLSLGRFIPVPVLEMFARLFASIYWHLAGHRREIVIQNLLPVLKGDRPQAVRAARALFTEFMLKITDLWRYESGVVFDQRPGEWRGWEHFTAAQSRGKGVLLVTPHLGNWEFGGTLLVQHGYKLVVLTQPEPDPRLTEVRQIARARLGVETLVVGQDAFAFIEIIKRLQAGVTVALLLDRPPVPTAVTVNLFDHPFSASNAAAELARASGCAIVPVYIVRQPKGHLAQILPEIPYDRAAIGNRAARIQLTQEILRAFEPVIRQHLTQWFHFIPIWPEDKRKRK